METDAYEKERLRRLIEETLLEHGVSFKRVIRDSPGRDAYLRFLVDRGERESDVLPMMDMSRITPEMYRQSFLLLLRELEKTRGKLDPAFAEVMFNSVRQENNTNLLIDRVSFVLEKKLEELGISFPPFYAAVYPTNTYNGEARQFEDQNLILLHTGLIETMEVVVTALIANIDRTQKSQFISEAVATLAKAGCIPSDKAIPTEDIDWGTLPTATLLNGAESFILLHEVGHLALGHGHEALWSKGGKPSRRELKRGWIREYEADAWAFNAVSQLGSKIRDRVDPEERQLNAMLGLFLGVVGTRLAENIELFGGLGSPRKKKEYLEWMSGPVIALGLGALIEETYSNENGYSVADHPPAMLRLRQLYGDRFSSVEQLVAPAARELLSIVRENGGDIPPEGRFSDLKDLLADWKDAIARRK